MVSSTVRGRKWSWKGIYSRLSGAERLAVPGTGEESCRAVPQPPHPGTAAHRMLPLMAKSPFMTYLTQARGHWDVMHSSQELLGDVEGWTTVPCGHSLYTSPKEGASSGPGSAQAEGWRGASRAVIPCSALHFKFHPSLPHTADLAVCGMCKQMVFKRSGWKDI